MSLSERLADSIVEIIRDEQLAPGAALASSRDLAKRFDVTTPTVREALRRLEATGIVEFRHGSGTYVGAGISRRVLANPHRPTIDRESVLELVDARLVLEPAIAAAAARTRAPEAMSRLEAAVTNALHPPAGDTRPAVHFHVALAAASGNRLLEESVEALLHVRVREQIEIRHRYDDRERDHAEHVRILAAIREGDPAAAETLTRTHLESIRKAIETAEFRAP
ncbi:FadR/GntR family transcriptional regulator [Actinophytocola algeriensis]|uniref:DNA-binding FadR family transcriptional regulator n=1 Tax=Actinophytocola algeriensis TaxID=1768010 RepID=A0A7W7QA85_9PSEU|nr:FCD domain-containing protein [Actinophytocola algeriensis]MBB4909865.1 DNA-binding FadR family transcriptional regulator [Actinophytocola algeriensis]MBE1475855.1 DNA-binding FadR family transcriptional regulator [Actinophytocola algeriensis]